MLGGLPGVRAEVGVAAHGRRLHGRHGKLTYGDVTDLSNYGGAVIDQRSFAKNVKAPSRAKSAAAVDVAVGGEYDGQRVFRPPHRALRRPDRRAFRDEYFKV